MEDGPGEITVLLQRWRAGDNAAESELFEMLLPDLRRIAGYCFRQERVNHTLQPTALVNEAFLRLAKARQIDWQSREHFLRVAARVMRRYLIDHARGRPNVNFLSLDDLPEPLRAKYKPQEWALAVDALLEELKNKSEQQRMVVQLKGVLGLTDSEAAEELHLSVRTLQREWHDARKWLFQRLTGE